MAAPQEQIEAKLIVYKKKITRLNKAVIGLVELGGKASVPVINIKVEKSVEVIEEIQNDLDIIDPVPVQEMYDEIVDLIAELECNVVELEAGIRKRAATGYLDKVTSLWSELEGKSNEDDLLEAFVSDRQKHLASLLAKWATVEMYVSEDTINEFESCVRKCQERLEILAVVRTAGSERGSSIAESAAHQQFEPRLDNRKPKFDSRNLPSWDGTSTTYLAWRMRFDTVISQYDVLDVQRDGLLLDEKVIKNTEIRNALVHLNLKQQLIHLDDNFDNSCRAFFGLLEGVKNRKKPTNADEYTYLQSAIKSLFTKINDMKDVTNMFKLALFSREFVHLYPDSVKDKILE
ncbi:MAG: hypothetical protein GY777_21940, partial [Candidatus Brocadiaceae bacterium]|nr:hypothetical protein [Candidatus Brocadiaceae bacterium]